MRSTLCLGMLLSAILLALPAQAGPLDDSTMVRGIHMGIQSNTIQGFHVEADGEPLELQAIEWTGAGTNIIRFISPSGNEHVLGGDTLATAMLAETVTISDTPEPGFWSIRVTTITGAATFDLLVHH